MTRTITESEALTLAVRGDVPGVLDGYAGPVIWGDRTERIALGRAHAGDALVVDDASDALSHWAPTAELRLPLAHPLVQAHLVGWLGRGERARCPCEGGYCTDPACDWPDDGSGYLRPRHNRYPWLTPADHGGLPDWIRLALIWGSVVRVAAGMGALAGAAFPRDPAGVRVNAGCPDRRADECLYALDYALTDNAPAGRVIRFEVPDVPA